MHSETGSAPVSAGARWTGRVLSYLPALFLLMDAGMKLAKAEVAVKKTMELGFEESVLVPLGVVLLASTILYLIPQSAGIGAILLTGYLGGAVATHVHHKDELWMILFPVVFGVLLWTGLVLRDRRLRCLLPGAG
jgi:hypothetical protein